MANTFDVNATNDELEAFAASSSAPAAPEKKKANVLYRLLALILAAFPILFFCLHPFEGVTVLDGYIAFFTNIQGFLEEVVSAFGADVSFGVRFVFEFLPYVALPVVSLICAIMAIVALFSGKAAPKCARAIAWLNFWAIGASLLTLVSDYYFLDKAILDVFASPDNMYRLYIAGGMALVGWVLSVINAPKKVWVSTLMFIFALAFNVVIVYMHKHFAFDFACFVALDFGAVIYYGTLAILLFSILGLLVSSSVLDKKKGFGGNMFVAVLHIIATLALLAVYLLFWQQGLFAQRLTLNGMEIQFSGYVACLIALGVVSVLEFIISIVRLSIKEKAAVGSPAEEVAPAEAPAEAATEEKPDYVVATPYQPISLDEYYAEEEEEEAVVEEEAEEVEEEEAPQAAPAPVAPVAPVAPAASAPVGETKLDDPFIATLTDEERKQFADVFILKAKGDFPGVPDYKAGEDNSAFFRKIFVYLGKYRARIPDDVLAKIYDFSVNN